MSKLCIDRFQPLLWPTVAALLMTWLLLSLAVWQSQRATEKQQREALFDSRISQPLLSLNPQQLRRLTNTTLNTDGDDDRWLLWQFRYVELIGQYASKRQYLLDNRTHNGVAGYEVLTPFKLRQPDIYVLINRGWVPIGADRQQLPVLAVDEKLRTVRGLITPPRQPFLLGDSGYQGDVLSRVVQSVEIDTIAHELSTPVLPFVVTLGASERDGFVSITKPYLGISATRHQAYALQWLSLAITVIVIYIVVSVQKGIWRRSIS